jgi:apolipoprotein N-acyltransferase
MDNPVVMSGPLFLLVLLQSFYWGLFSAVASFVGHRTRIPWFVVLPVLWVTFEQLRSLGVIGFTWGALGYATVNVPRAIQFASVTGVFGVSLWLALSNVLVLEVVSERRRRRALATALAAVLLLPVMHGTLVLRGADSGQGGEGAGRSMRVAVIQPNISAATKWDTRYKSESFEALGRLSLQAADRKPDLIVWPETAAPSYLLYEPEDLALIADVARQADTPILTGCPNLVPGDAEEGTGRPLNSVLLIDTDGIPRAAYSKMKLVPFGEAIPFETVIPFLREVDFGEADFWPGSERRSGFLARQRARGLRAPRWRLLSAHLLRVDLPASGAPIRRRWCGTSGQRHQRCVVRTIVDAVPARIHGCHAGRREQTQRGAERQQRGLDADRPVRARDGEDCDIRRGLPCGQASRRE